MKKFSILIIWLYSFNLLFAQSYKISGLEIYSVPLASSEKLFVDFKIPFKNLVFVKDKSGYVVSSTAVLEIFSDDSLFFRKILKRKISVPNFNNTKANDKFLHSFFSAELPRRFYNLNFKITLNGSARYFTNVTENLDFTQTENSILEPIIGNEVNKNVFSVISMNGNLPFSPKNFSLVIPILNNNSVCKISIRQFGKEVFRDSSSLSIKGSPLFAMVGENFLLTPKSCNKNYGMFIFNNFGKKLLPGDAEIIVSLNNTEKHFPIKINWENSPHSLGLDFVLENSMEMIFTTDEIERYSNTPSRLKPKALFEMWEKFDPDTSNSYNEILNEFLRRVDFSVENFSLPKTQNGYKTDRGLIYISFGKPIKIKREFSEFDSNMEIWYYGNRKFIFVDEKGNGNYILVNEK